MPAGRRQPLARALKEYSLMAARQQGSTENLTLEEALERVYMKDDFISNSISRRDVLRAGGVLGAGLALAGIGGKRALAATPGPDAAWQTIEPTINSPKVVVIGAGLAGTTAAYQLNKQGVEVQLYEARDRIGGRCWSATKGWTDGQQAEHGGEFIDTRHVHMLQLADELGLVVEDLWDGWPGGSIWLNYIDGEPIRHTTLKQQLDPVIKKLYKTAERIGVYASGPNKPSDRCYSYGTATDAAKQLDGKSMFDWLQANFPSLIGSQLHHYLEETMAAWYGLGLRRLSAINWIDYFLIPYPGGDERWHIVGGNDRVPRAAANTLPAGSIHLETPLEAVKRLNSGGYELKFKGVGTNVKADAIVITMPYTTLRDVDLTEAGFGAHQLKAIDQLGMGTGAKVLLQYNKRPWLFQTAFGKWSGVMEHTRPNFETWESSTNQPGASGIITAYPGGRTGAVTFAAPGIVHGPCPDPLKSNVVGWIDEAVPGTAAEFNGKAWVDWWTGDPWTHGSYAAFLPGQMTRFWKGTGKAQGRCHLAGEHTSSYSQGFLNGGVESGDRAAVEVMKQFGIPVPSNLAALPYSKVG